MWEVLASNAALGVALAAVVAALAWWQRTGLRDIVGAPEPTWRAIAWGALGLVVVLIIWGSVADDWRKMFGELLDLREEFPSQRAVQQPVPGGIRAVTLALLVPALLLAGAVFARYLGGYGLQLVLIIVGFSSFFPLYLFRQRLDLGLVGIVVSAPSGLSVGTFASLFYLLMDYAANIALILTSYLALLGLFALPVTALLDLLGRRDPPASPSAATTDFYAQIRANVAARQAERAKGDE